MPNAKKIKIHCEINGFSNFQFQARTEQLENPGTKIVPTVTKIRSRFWRQKSPKPNRLEALLEK
jgi:hypothetical protein